MSIIDTLKGLWDPRTEKEKMEQKQPLMKACCTLHVYVQGDKFAKKAYVHAQDLEAGSLGIFRFASDEKSFKGSINDALRAIQTRGIITEAGWFPAERIDRVTIGEIVRSRL